MWRAAARLSCIALAGLVCACGGTESTGDDDSRAQPAPTATTENGRSPINTPGPLVTEGPRGSETATATATETPLPTPTVTETPSPTPPAESSPDENSP